MQQRYGKEGLVCMSVSVDDSKDHARALAFLTRQKATFANYRLDEESEVWQKKWKIEGPPGFFVFDRQGYRARRFYADRKGSEFTAADVEKVVKELLRKAP
jgi:hypothetical protein